MDQASHLHGDVMLVTCDVILSDVANHLHGDVTS